MCHLFFSKGAYYWYRREQEKMAHQIDEGE